MNNEIPAALRKAGIKRVNTNLPEGQELTLKPGLLGLFFGEELAAALLKKQKRQERAHG